VSCSYNTMICKIDFFLCQHSFQFLTDSVTSFSFYDTRYRHVCTYLHYSIRVCFVQAELLISDAILVVVAVSMTSEINSDNNPILLLDDVVDPNKEDDNDDFIHVGTADDADTAAAAADFDDDDFDDAQGEGNVFSINSTSTSTSDSSSLS